MARTIRSAGRQAGRRRRCSSMSPRLMTAYYSRQARSCDRRRSASRSAHRAIAARHSTPRFNEDHILAITQAICLYRSSAGIDGPLFLGMDTHALSEAGLSSALEVLAANGVETMIDAHGGYTPTPVISHAILTYNQGRTSGLGRRHRHHARRTIRPRMAASNTIPPMAAPPMSTSPTGSRTPPTISSQDKLDGVKRIPFERARKPACVHAHDYIDALCRRSRQCRRHGGDPRRRRADRHRSAGRRGGALLGADHRALQDRRDGGERRRRSDLSLHDRRLGRQDPHGLFLALCDDAADRDARTNSTSPSPTTPMPTGTASSARRAA